MSFAMVANFGAGLAYLAAVFAISAFSIVWFLVWSIRRFRDSGQFGVHDLRWWAIRLGPWLILAALFVPMRQSGEWHADGGQKTPSYMAIALDRFWFGDIPSLRWVGDIGLPVPLDASTSVSLEGSQAYRLEAVCWKIDWSAVCAEALLLVLIFFPFVPVKKPTGAGG
jgi:hypothetical protein